MAINDNNVYAYTWSTGTMHHEPTVCPVCKGKGLKHPSFYSEVGKEKVKCRACNGKGVIVPNCTHVHNHPQPVYPKPWQPDVSPAPMPYWQHPITARPVTGDGGMRVTN